MDFEAAQLSEDEAYKLLVGAVVPRPIAWVTSLMPSGQVNLAPFSAFTFLSRYPPMIGVSISRRGGKLKDTARNIETEREFVVNVADEKLLELLHLSSAELPPEESEVEKLRLDVVPSINIRTPRLAIAPVNLECEFEQAIEFGDPPTRLVVGKVVRFHVRDDVCINGRIDTARLKPIARVAGPRYTKLGEIIAMDPMHGAGPKSTS